MAQQENHPNPIFKLIGMALCIWMTVAFCTSKPDTYQDHSTSFVAITPSQMASALEPDHHHHEHHRPQ